MSRLKIAVLFGGCSPEYGVSLQSAAVLRHMDNGHILYAPRRWVRHDPASCGRARTAYTEKLAAYNQRRIR